MFENLLRIAMFGNEKNLPKQECSDNSDTTMQSCTEQAATLANEEHKDDELAILSAIYGELTVGRTLEVSLQNLLCILPRKRKRADAYKGLVSKLKDIGVSLVIHSRKRK